MLNSKTIVALSTPQGIGAIGVIRLSGFEAISITQKIFKGKNLLEQATHTIHFGHIIDKNDVIDEVVVAIFKEPHSFTKENVIEISCHGSNYIIQKIIKLLLENGASYASPGEFTQRAFINGRFDLAQAEAVADLIASDNESAHKAALNQMRGGFSQNLKNLRQDLVTFYSLIELELDFAEEDVAFANRNDLKTTVLKINAFVISLLESFSYGNAIKNGIPTVIAGKPNAGKSTLLNALFNEEKAIVSEIAGTTRDVIEDELIIEGVKFRFIDTAGIRETADKLEAIGIERTKKKIAQASLLLYIFDIETENLDDLIQVKQDFSFIPTLFVANHIDKLDEKTFELKLKELKNINIDCIFISAKNDINILILKDKIVKTALGETFSTGDSLVTNIRHYENLKNANSALENILLGLENDIFTDLLAQEIRQAVYFIGQITGEVTNDEILETIFSKFCIGK